MESGASFPNPLCVGDVEIMVVFSATHALGRQLV